MFFNKLVDKENDRVKFKIIAKTKEEYISVKYGCIGFIDSYLFLPSSLDSLVKTLVDNCQKILKSLKEEIVDNDEILNTVNEIKFLFEEDVFNNISNRDSKKDYLDEIIELEEALLNYMGENGLRILKRNFLINGNIYVKKWQILMNILMVSKIITKLLTN